MKTKSVYLLFISLLSVLFIISCASRGNLSGGEEDVEPPQLLSANPPLGSTNIQPTKIELVFNENLKLSNLNSNLLISPVMENRPEIKQKAKSFTIELQDSLLPNTTYTFNFGSSITDLNEGNELAGFTYVFSTGEEIDKGKLSGTVVDAQSGQAPENDYLWALLYENISDTSVKTLSPNYVAPVDEEGNFEFNYLAEKEYRLYIVKDNNSNFYYDLPNELIAYTDSVYVVDTTAQIINEPFVLFEQEDTLPKIISRERTKNFVTISTNFRPSVSDSLSLIDNYNIDYLGDSIRVWLPENSTENELYLSLNGTVIDTVSINQWDTTKVDTTLKVNPKGLKNFSYYNEKKISFSQPVADINREKIVLLEDSLFVAGGVLFRQDSLNTTQLWIEHDWNYGKQYDLTFNDSTFQSVYGLYSDSLTVSFTTPDLESLGTLLVNVDSVDVVDPLVVQVVKNDNIIAEKIATEATILRFPQLIAGNYQIQVIIDSNGNAEWDTGSFDEGRQPETILRFQDEINVRSNWEIEVDLEI